MSVKNIELEAASRTCNIQSGEGERTKAKDERPKVDGGAKSAEENQRRAWNHPAETKQTGTQRIGALR